MAQTDLERQIADTFVILLRLTRQYLRETPDDEQKVGFFDILGMPIAAPPKPDEGDGNTS